MVVLTIISVRPWFCWCNQSTGPESGATSWGGFAHEAADAVHVIFHLLTILIREMFCLIVLLLSQTTQRRVQEIFETFRTKKPVKTFHSTTIQVFIFIFSNCAEATLILKSHVRFKCFWTIQEPLFPNVQQHVVCTCTDRRGR